VGFIDKGAKEGDSFEDSQPLAWKD
jgi:hypothetical protein